jgi:hypothetical protein
MNTETSLKNTSRRTLAKQKQYKEREHQRRREGGWGGGGVMKIRVNARLRNDNTKDHVPVVISREGEQFFQIA